MANSSKEGFIRRLADNNRDVSKKPVSDIEVNPDEWNLILRYNSERQEAIGLDKPQVDNGQVLTPETQALKSKGIVFVRKNSS